MKNSAPTFFMGVDKFFCFGKVNLYTMTVLNLTNIVVVLLLVLILIKGAWLGLAVEYNR